MSFLRRPVVQQFKASLILVQALHREAAILKLRRFRIDGYKALSGVDITVHDNLLFLIGANNSGKSSILQALAFIQSIFCAGQVDKLLRRPWMDSARCFEARPKGA